MAINKDTSLEQPVTQYDMLAQRINNLEEKMDNNTEKILSKINTLQWVGGFLIIGIFMPLVIFLWQTIFK